MPSLSLSISLFLFLSPSLTQKNYFAYLAPGYGEEDRAPSILARLDVVQQRQAGLSGILLNIIYSDCKTNPWLTWISCQPWKESIQHKAGLKSSYKYSSLKNKERSLRPTFYLCFYEEEFVPLNLVNDLLLVPGRHYALHVGVRGEEADHAVWNWNISSAWENTFTYVGEKAEGRYLVNDLLPVPGRQYALSQELEKQL